MFLVTHKMKKNSSGASIREDMSIDKPCVTGEISVDNFFKCGCYIFVCQQEIILWKSAKLDWRCSLAWINIFLSSQFSQIFKLKTVAYPPSQPTRVAIEKISWKNQNVHIVLYAKRKLQYICIGKNHVSPLPIPTQMMFSPPLWYSEYYSFKGLSHQIINAWKWYQSKVLC